MARFINFASYNLHGFQQGKSQLLELCDSHDIIVTQEHWLSSCDLDRISNLHSDFTVVAKSAMAEKVQTGFLRGRPFGGLAVLVKKSVSSKVKIVGVNDKCRCLAVVITLHGGYKILVIDVYFPCYEPGQEYQSVMLDCIGFIENCIVLNDHDAVLILGDFNFECDNNHVGYKMFNNLCSEYKLMCCDSFAQSDIQYTYCHDSLGRFSVIDHVFVNTNLAGNVINYRVVDSGINLSDHVPVSCTMALPVSTGLTVGSQQCRDKGNIMSNILRWDKGDLTLYYQITSQLLQQVHVPYDLLLAKCDDHICIHQEDINCFYKELVNVMKYAAGCAIPLVRDGNSKPYWNVELQQLKEDSIQAHLAWTAIGKPRQGWLNRFRLHCKYKYKIAIKTAALAFEWDLDDELSDHYLRKDMDQFWKKWKKRFSKRNNLPLHIGGFTDPQDIANQFKEAFSDYCFDSYDDKDSISELCVKLSNSDDCDLHSRQFNVSDVEKALEKMKMGKASGFDGIVKEHLLYSHPSIIIYLMLLFNMMATHCFVPDDFGTGVMVPIIKDSVGDASDVNNYRGITLSPVISKLFEYCVMEKFHELAVNNDLQFGFKQKLGCSHAIFALRQCVEYFVSRGSTVFMAALDARKAFDRVNHIKLFHLMCDAGIPVHIIRLLMNWYSKILIVVKWNGSYSSFCSLKSGVRQGGVLSPILFNIYINYVISSLSLSDLGCHINGVYIGCLVYADDIILLSASVGHLQMMLDICYVRGIEIDIMFNAKKSSLFVVGKACDVLIDTLRIGQDTIHWNKNMKYLGVQFKSGHVLQTDNDTVVRKFYAAANAICSHVKFASEMSVLFLMETFCLPLLSYSCEALSYSKQQLNQLNICWNRAYRKVFKMNDWESVKEVQALCGRLDFMHIYAQRKLIFISKISRLNNDVMKACFDNFCRSDESMRLHCEFDSFVGAPADDIRDAVFNNFYSIAITK